MKDIDIKWFGSKMMVASKSINKIPNHYLKLAYNSRIYDAWIWPRKWKRLLVESIVWTFNKWWFLLKNELYQITNSRIYKIFADWRQEEKAFLGYDLFTDILVYERNFAIIVAKWQKLKIFDGNNIFEPHTVPSGESWNILEYSRGYTFYWIWNILYISRPILPNNPERAYDFIWEWSQTITYDSEITWLKWTMNWIYVFTKEKVEFIWADSLQNINGSPTFLSSPLWDAWEPINNQSIIATWDKIFFITKNLQLKTINFVPWIESSIIWNLNNESIVSIKEFLNTLDDNQDIGFWFYNKNDETIQFHLKTKNFKYNNRTLVFDLLNNTFSIDVWKNYCYMVNNGNKYFWFSSVNSSIYEDDVGNTDAWIPISFKIVTNNMNMGTIRQKKFGGFFTAWAISIFSELNYIVKIDWNIVFSDSIKWKDFLVSEFWEIWGFETWKLAIWWNLDFWNKIFSFEKLADEWRIYKAGTKIQIEINSSSEFQDFIIDILWVRCEDNNNIDIKDKW